MPAVLKFINAKPYLVGSEKGAIEALEFGDEFTVGTDEDGNVTITLAATFDPTFDDLTADTIDATATATDKLSLTGTSELTIATGAVTATGSIHTIDTEEDGATDDLETISGTTAGQILVISAAHTDRSVVAKDGVGNLKLGGDRTLDNVEDRLVLISDGTNLYELCFAGNGA